MKYIFIILSLFFANTAFGATFVVDSFWSASTTGQVLSDSNVQRYAQCFSVGTTTTLDSAQMFLKKTGTPSANYNYYVYAITGGCGTSGKPTGDPLATSLTGVSTDLTTSYATTTLNFTGADRITLNSGTDYVIAIRSDNTGGSNHISTGDCSSCGDNGNASYYLSSSWTANANNDMNFRVYGYYNEAGTSTIATTTALSVNNMTMSTLLAIIYGVLVMVIVKLLSPLFRS